MNAVLVGLPRRIKSCNGFTLVEIILVVLLLTVVAGLTAPNLAKSLAKHQFEKSADELLNLMRYAQSRAITKGHNVRLEFNDEQSQYWLSEVQAANEDIDSDEIFKRITGQMGGVRQVPEEVEISLEELRSITFYADGRIDRTELSVCKSGRCKRISTKIQRGFIRSFDSEEPI